MFNLLSKKQLIVAAASTSRFFCYPSRFLELSQSASLVIRFSSAVKSKSSEIDEQQSLTLSYLINSCGLSAEAAKVASMKVRLKSPEKSDLLLTLLKNHGLSDAQITKMVTKIPRILAAHPEKTVLPKLQFFHSIGMPASVLAVVISRSPNILRWSLEKSIIPFYRYLKGLLQEDERVIIVFKRMAAYFLPVGLQQLPQNVAILRMYGMSESNISSFVVNRSKPLMMRSDELVKLVDKVLELGIDISKFTFIEAIYVLQCTSKSTWEHRKEVYRRWGWSESDVLVAFSIHPICMILSEKKIMSTMEFLVDEMNCEPRAIARSPAVLLYSLEKRIVPRCRVVKLLMAKGLMKNSYNLVSFFVMTDKKFAERFVTKYENIPQLLDVYHGKLGLLDLGLNSSELANVKLL